MWGTIDLIKFYPKNWQASMYRSMHPWLLHTTIWHYWLLFTFTVAMNLFFIYIFKAITYQRVDIRGTKSTGEKRRIAWPEMLIVIVPFYWAVNIVINALAYLRVLEGSCGQVLLTVQVNAFQWGWKYCYSDTFYSKFFNNPIYIGNDSTVKFNDSIEYINRTTLWNMENKVILKKIELSYDIEDDHFDRVRFIDDIEKTEFLRWDWTIEENDDSDLTVESYFSRKWLKFFGNIENELNNKTKNKKWQNGYWLTSQGLDPNISYYEEYLKSNNIIENELIKDPLRLLRTSGALVLPTRSNLRLMACSDDITHSWAVPALGLKMDCVPGRVFCIYLNIIRDGIYFGQCSELCGWNHYNMPIVVYALPVEHFIIWWEIELHTIFNKKYYNYNKKIFKKDNLFVTYKLINYKFK